MSNIMYHTPGTQVTIVIETLNELGVRADGYELPIVNRIIFPSLTLADNYPQSMVQIDTGLYYHKFTLPTGATSIGSYIADVSYIDPADSLLKDTMYQIVVTTISGNFGTSS